MTLIHLNNFTGMGVSKFVSFDYLGVLGAGPVVNKGKGRDWVPVGYP